MRNTRGSTFLYVTFLAIFTVALFALFDLTYLSPNVSLAFPIITGVLFILVFSAMLRTSLSDPGIIPRARPGEVLEMEERAGQFQSPIQGPEAGPSPPTKVVTIRGQPITLKYCVTCCIFRPPRASHCSLCDNCVQHFDHHCSWLDNCIGVRNYRHFYTFISFLSVMNIFMAVSTCVHLYLLSQDLGGFSVKNLWEAVKQSPGSPPVVIITVSVVIPVLKLLYFHTTLLATGLTNNEWAKDTFEDIQNPYHAGSCYKNCWQTLCLPEKPSLVGKKRMPLEDGSPTIFIDAKLLEEMATRAQARRQQQMRRGQI